MATITARSAFITTSLQNLLSLSFSLPPLFSPSLLPSLPSSLPPSPFSPSLLPSLPSSLPHSSLPSHPPSSLPPSPLLTVPPPFSPFLSPSLLPSLPPLSLPPASATADPFLLHPPPSRPTSGRLSGLRGQLLSRQRSEPDPPSLRSSSDTHLPTFLDHSSSTQPASDLRLKTAVSFPKSTLTQETCLITLYSPGTSDWPSSPATGICGVRHMPTALCGWQR